MSRAGKVVVVSGTVVSGNVVSGIAVSSVAGTVSRVDDSVTLFDPLEAVGVLLTAQADNNTKFKVISAAVDRKK
jgi:hypothetical protein